MKVLVISNIEWDDRNAFGNTVSNLFSDWEDTSFLSIYARSSYPNNKVCTNYYSISVQSVLRNFLHKEGIGYGFDLSKVQQSNKRNQVLEMGKKHPIIGRIMRHFASLLYSFRLWQNNKYKRLIDSFEPDICFSFAKPDVFLYENIKFVKEKTNAKIVTYIVDDVYSSGNIVEKKRLERMLELSDIVYGISVPLCVEYSKRFNKEVRLLQKGCLFSDKIVNQSIGFPIKIVYAGNLYYGRDIALLEVSKVLLNLPVGSCFLDIYTSTQLSQKMEDSFRQCSKVVCFHSQRPYAEIKSILSNADIVLHIESSKPRDMRLTRLSFSTKIIDYFQSGSAILVFGPSGVASIDYLKSIEGVYYASNQEQLFSVLRGIVEVPEKLRDKARLIREYAEQNHSSEKVKEIIRTDFLTLN